MCPLYPDLRNLRVISAFVVGKLRRPSRDPLGENEPMTGTSPPPARPEGEQRAAAALTARTGYQAKKLLPALRLGAGKCRFSALKCAPFTIP
jgi:hypothetical protein